MHWPESLVKSVSSGLREMSCLRKKGGEQLRNSQVFTSAIQTPADNCACSSTYTWANIHICTHTYTHTQCRLDWDCRLWLVISNM